MTDYLSSILWPCVLGVAATVFASPTLGQETNGAMLTNQQATMYARLALTGIVQEYPNKPSNVMHSRKDVRAPRDMHPAFYGSFDWHSAVHGHWLLVRVLRTFPDNELAAEIRQTLRQQLGAEVLQQEAEYFESDHNKHFERMYGWAWLLQLTRELHSWKDDDGRQWRQNIEPLESIIVRRIRDYLPKLSFPIRVGTHTDTAFALGMIIDYAVVVGDRQLLALVGNKARDFYLNDRNYPAHYEPSGHDFFSSGFNEADLMRRLLASQDYSEWLDRFLPGLRTNDLGTMIQPVEVTDVTDGHLVHLAGLDLSRAWTMTGIAMSLEENDPRRHVLEHAIPAHVEAGLKYVDSGHYAGEHWLATFAVYYLTGSAIEVKPPRP